MHLGGVDVCLSERGNDPQAALGAPVLPLCAATTSRTPKRVPPLRVVSRLRSSQTFEGKRRWRAQITWSSWTTTSIG